MKTIGLLGGMSWESTVTYYKLINQGVNRRLGGYHSAKCLLHNVNFAEIEAMQTGGRWEEAGQLLGQAAAGLQAAGAECMVLCTNTMHKVAPFIQQAIGIPFLHIADATADALLAGGVGTVGLLGTRYTMEQTFYTEKLEAKGLRVLVPGAGERALVNRVIFEELCQGVAAPASKQAFLRIIHGFSRQGAQAVILGCTEIGLLVKQADTPVPLFDTTAIHAAAAVDFALSL